MSIGDNFKQAFKMIFELSAGPMLIHKRYGTPQVETVEIRGMKNNEKGRLDKVMFQFPERQNIEVGDVLQVKGANDLWRVIDTEEDIQNGVYVNFEAKVQKITGGPQGRVFTH